jgi:FKBP-type peptidyl-prolyl cis-trans isomerase FklB
MKKLCMATALVALAMTFANCSSKDSVTTLKNDDQKISYMIGLDMGAYLKNLGITIDKAALDQGIEDTLMARKQLMTKEEVMKLKEDFGKKMQAQQMSKAKVIGDKNAKEGADFLAKNKTEKGVITTASGLQYTIIKEGAGAKPKSTDMVSVNYRGTLLDGKEFDSSYKRGQPASFPVTGVIPGWTEALQLMKVGTKAKLFIPSNLAYGERSMGPDIGPNSTLIFELELLEIKAPAAPGAPTAAAPAKPVPPPAAKK